MISFVVGALLLITSNKNTTIKGLDEADSGAPARLQAEEFSINSLLANFPVFLLCSCMIFMGCLLWFYWS